MQKKRVGLIATAITIAVGTGIAANSAPAYAFTAASDFTDVRPTHWAFKAIKELVEKYRVMEGYPDKTFKGSRNMTRYEMAAALLRVMEAVEALIAGRQPGQPQTDMSGDLATLARLQQEFKKELEDMKVKVDALDGRVTKLESGLKLTGEMDIKFRDRFLVANNTDSFGAIDPGSTSGTRTLFTSNNLNPFEYETNLNLRAQITPNFRYDGAISLWYEGVAQNGLENAGGTQSHWFNEAATGLPVFLHKSMVTWNAYDMDKDQVNLNLHAGLMNLDESVHTGTNMPNKFAGEAWVGHGFGFVGSGAAKAAATNASGVTFDAAGNVTGGSFTYTGKLLPRFWGSGIDASRVDPNSKNYNRLPSLGVAGDVSFLDKGTLRIAAGVEQGPFGRTTPGAQYGSFYSGTTLLDDLTPGFTDISGRVWRNFEAYSGGMNLDPPSFYDDNYWVGEVTLDLNKMANPIPIMLRGNWMFYNRDQVFNYTGTRDEFSGVLDIGLSNWLGGDSGSYGITIQGNKSVRTARDGLRPSIWSAAFIADDFMKTGIGWGLGGKLETASMFNLTGGPFDASGATGQGSRGDYSLGGYIYLPKVEYLPGVLLAAQQSFGPGLIPGTPATPGTLTQLSMMNKLWQTSSSGITLQIPFKNINGWPWDVTLEWDDQFEGAIFRFKSVATDIAVISSLRF